LERAGRCRRDGRDWDDVWWGAGQEVGGLGRLVGLHAGDNRMATLPHSIGRSGESIAAFAAWRMSMSRIGCAPPSHIMHDPRTRRWGRDGSLAVPPSA
jgi:hypothetical protein